MVREKLETELYNIQHTTYDYDTDKFEELEEDADTHLTAHRSSSGRR